MFNCTVNFLSELCSFTDASPYHSQASRSYRTSLTHHDDKMLILIDNTPDYTHRAQMYHREFADPV